MKPRISRYFVCAVVIAAALSCGAGSSLARAETPANLGMAPVFARPDLQHKTVKLDAYRGKVVLLNFWASWCAPCLKEMPQFSSWQTSYGQRGLQVVGISMDDTEPPVRAIFQKLHLNYPVMMGDAELGELYGGILGLPVTYVIDSARRIALATTVALVAGMATPAFAQADYKAAALKHLKTSRNFTLKVADQMPEAD